MLKSFGLVFFFPSYSFSFFFFYHLIILYFGISAAKSFVPLSPSLSSVASLCISSYPLVFLALCILLSLVSFFCSCLHALFLPRVLLLEIIVSSSSLEHGAVISLYLFYVHSSSLCLHHSSFFFPSSSPTSIAGLLFHQSQRLDGLYLSILPLPISLSSLLFFLLLFYLMNLSGSASYLADIGVLVKVVEMGIGPGQRCGMEM